MEEVQEQTEKVSKGRKLQRGDKFRLEWQGNSHTKARVEGFITREEAQERKDHLYDYQNLRGKNSDTFKMRPKITAISEPVAPPPQEPSADKLAAAAVDPQNQKLEEMHGEPALPPEELVPAQPRDEVNGPMPPQ